MTKLNLTIPSHITRFELEFGEVVSKMALTAKTGGNHVRLERNLNTTKIAFDGKYYLQSVVNEIAEALI